jgi:hypothetical protein
VAIGGTLLQVLLTIGGGWLVGSLLRIADRRVAVPRRDSRGEQLDGHPEVAARSR